MTAIAAGTGQVALYLLAGILTGFGKSSAQFSTLSLFGLAFFLITSTAGTELGRTRLIRGIPESPISLLLVSFFFFILEVPLSQFSIFEFSANFFIQTSFKDLPLFAGSIFATLLALQGGAGASFIYRMSVLAFWFFCPVLPALDLPIKCFIGTLVPVLGISFLAYQNRSRQTRQAERFRDAKKFPIGQVATGVGVMVVTWFIGGLLPFQPLAVASGSMSPAMNVGDIAVFIKVPPEELKVNDILVFRKETSTVIHRITEVSSNSGPIYFTTQGDANNAPDASPVEYKDIKGKVLFTIPKLGQISLALKDLHPPSQTTNPRRSGD